MPKVLPFLLILFVLAALLRVDFFFTVVYLVGAVYLLSRIWVRWVSQKVTVSRRFTDHAFLGDEVEVEVRLRNQGWLPAPWLSVHESLPVQLAAPSGIRRVLAVGPRQDRQLSYTLHCRRRGYYDVGPLSIQIGDLLGMARQRQMQLESAPMVVYPKVVPLQALGLPTRAPLAALPTRSPLFEDPTRLMGVRDYKAGDSPRRMHWTATASAGRLLVKQYQHTVARETLVCLDLDRSGYGQRQQYDASELAIVVAASLAHHIAVQEGLPVGLMTDARDPLVDNNVRFYVPPKEGRAHLMQVLEVLARAQLTQGNPLGQMLRRASVDLPWGATVVVVTGREEEDLLDHLLYLKRAGFAVSLILVRPGRTSADVQALTGRSSVPVHHIWHERDMGLLA